MGVDTPLVLTPRLVWGVASAVGIGIGSVGPWATWGAFSISGAAGDGKFTLTISVIVAILILVDRWPVAVGVGAAIAAASGSVPFVTAARYSDPRVIDAIDADMGIGVGWGAILVVASAASLGVWAALILLRDNRRVAAAISVATGALLVGLAIWGAGTLDTATADDDPGEPIAAVDLPQSTPSPPPTPTPTRTPSPPVEAPDEVVTDTFVTQSGRIACSMLEREAGAISVRCGLRDGRSGLMLGEFGAAATASWDWPEEIGLVASYDEPLFATGQLWEGRGEDGMIRCIVDIATGVTCTNNDGRGFTLAREGRLRF